MSNPEQQTSATASRSSGHGLLIANLLVQIAFGLMAMTICLPSMQQWGEIFSAGQPAVQLTFSAYVVAYGGLQLMYGPLSDRFGRRPVLLAGLACALVGAVMAMMATDIVWLTFARMVQGAGSAAGMAIGRAIVQDLFTGSERTRIMAFIGMALGVMPPLATVVGGAIHEALGWRANFVLMAVVSLLLLIAAWRGLPAGRPPSIVRRHWVVEMLSSYWILLRQSEFLMYVLLLGCTTATFYVFLSGAPIVLKSYGVGPAGIGWYIMVCPLCYILGNFITSRYVHAWGERTIMIIGQLLTVAGVILMWVLSALGWDTAWAFAMPTMLVGLGHGFLVPPALTGTVGLNPALAGAAAGVAGLSQQCIGAFGGFTVGLVHHEGALNVSLLMMAFTGMGLLMVVLISLREQQHRA